MLAETGNVTGIGVEHWLLVAVTVTAVMDFRSLERVQESFAPQPLCDVSTVEEGVWIVGEGAYSRVMRAMKSSARSSCCFETRGQVVLSPWS